MTVPIALYATPPSSVCSHTTFDFDLTSRSSSSVASTPSTSQKPAAGGLSCLFSSSAVKHGGGDEVGSVWAERSEELSSSFRYSQSKFSNRDHQSPISVFQGPFSSGCSGVSSSARSPPMRIGRERSSGGSDVRLFNGFVRGALGSTCLDYNSPGFGFGNGDDGDGVALLDELTFSMDDGFGDSGDLEPYARELLTGAQMRHTIFYDDFVVTAFCEAEKAHRGQMRVSGDHYLQHCVETAVLLALIGANSTVVAAGLLHDTLDDSVMSYDYIYGKFGAGVTDLVEGVSKLSHLSKLARDNNTACKTVEADRLHTMFLGMADARAVLIKLADRLHNMMTLDALSLSKQQMFAKETLEIFVPLANRLGVSSWKVQLENICFKHLNPDQYTDLSSKLEDLFDDAMITSATTILDQALKEKSISYHVLCGRHKSLYSIYCKMLKKKLIMSEILDINGLRLIVDKEEDCYQALEVVQQLWTEFPGKYKDYISHPKCNGYQSLHTVVMGEGMIPLEVQIRTKEMHLQAEFGFAAHWRYKEGDRKHPSFVLQMVEWARWVVTWQCEAMSRDRSSITYADSIRPPCTFPSHSDDCPYSYKSHSGGDEPVFVIMIENDKMSVQEFAANSTIMDLVERAGNGSMRWTTYGLPLKEELRPRLNQMPASDPTYKLQMGDVVELTPAIPDKSLTEYREEIQRMYDRGRTVSSIGSSARSVVGWRR